jgi:acetyl-CoA carboxylase carboxyl transferase subunit alpha
VKAIEELRYKTPEERINDRIEKYGKMGFWEEASV